MSRCLAILLAISVSGAVFLLSFERPATATTPEAYDAAHDAGVHVMGPGDPVEPFMSAICPDGLIVDDDRAACRFCPDEAPRDRGMLNLRRVYRGHFSGGSKQEAVVALNGCADDVEQRHATAFLRQVDPGENRWELLRYEQGTRTTPCRVVMLGHRPILLCRTGTTVSGFAYHGERWHSSTLAQIGDGDGDSRCEYEGTRVHRVQHVLTGPFIDGIPHSLGVLLKLRHGTPISAQGDECSADNFDIEYSWRLDVFLLGDDGFEPMDIDEPCAQPNRARILTAADPYACLR